MRISTVKLQLQVPEQQAASVKTGMSVTARVAAYPNRDFTGKVHAVVPSWIQTPAHLLSKPGSHPSGTSPGMFANAKLMLQGKERTVSFFESGFLRQYTDANNIYSVVTA